MSVLTEQRDRCPDCEVAIGQLHKRGCDVERCSYCGLQAIGCKHRVPDDDRLPWTGTMPGVDDCHRLGLFAKMVPGKGWTPCDKDEKGAIEDLNSLYTLCTWSREKKQWERKA